MSKDIIARLEAAMEGSRELDASIWQLTDPQAACGASYAGRAFADRDWTEEEKARKAEDRVRRLAPAYTISIDAALNLMPAGCEWTRHLGANGKMTMQVGNSHGQGATPALALCIAALKARQP